MALNFHELIRMLEFGLELKSQGNVRCLSLNTKHITQANNRLRETDGQSIDVVSWLFGEMTRRPVNGDSDDEDITDALRLTTEELNSVTDDKLEEFAEKLIQKNWYLLKTHKGRDVERSIDETACDFLVRAFRHYTGEQKLQLERMTAPLSKSLFASTTTVEAMQCNLSQQSALGAIAEANRYLAEQSVSVTNAMNYKREYDLMSASISPFQGIQQYLDQSYASTTLAKAFNHNEDIVRGAIRKLTQRDSMSAVVLDKQQVTHALLKSHEAMFRLPQAIEATSLLASCQIGAVAGFAQRYTQDIFDMQRFLGAITAPWVNSIEAARSVTGILELQGIGSALRNVNGFDLELTIALRQDFGDWRDKITFPESVFIDPVARSNFYVSRGFNTALTDFPEEAFHQSLELAGLDGETLNIELLGPVVRPSINPEEEVGLRRTNKCHDLLQRFERLLRQFINDAMTAQYGSNWAKKRLAPRLYEDWEFKKQRAESNGVILTSFIEVADFSDYETIICKQDHWREVFEARFKKKDSVRESLQRLQPIRVTAMHSRIVTKEDELYLYAEVVRLLSAIK